MLAFALIVSLFTLFNNGYVEPIAKRSYDDLVDSFFYTRPPPEVQENVAYRIQDDSIYFAGRVRADEDNSKLATLSGIYVLKEDGSSITAPEGEWDSEARRWTLYDAQVVGTDGQTGIQDELELVFEIESDASVSLTDSEALTLLELNERINEVQSAGGDLRQLRYTFHTRIADAFSSFIFALIASVLGLQLHNRAAGFGWTIALLVVFWSIWTLSGSLFEQGVLSPVMAAWFTSAIVGGAGLVVAWLRLR